MSLQYDPIIAWQAPEYRHYDKNIAWYITFVILFVLFFAYLIIQGDWFGAISVGLLGALTVAFSRQKPKLIDIVLSDKGVHLEDLHIPYSHIRHFWIVDNEHHKLLNIETTTYLNNEIGILLEDQDPELVREMLIAVLPEHTETDETLAQRIAHKFKF